MNLKRSLNMVLVLALYLGILIAGLAGILKCTLVLAVLAILFLVLLANLIRERRA